MLNREGASIRPLPARRQKKCDRARRVSHSDHAKAVRRAVPAGTRGALSPCGPDSPSLRERMSPPPPIPAPRASPLLVIALLLVLAASVMCILVGTGVTGGKLGPKL